MEKRKRKFFITLILLAFTISVGVLFSTTTAYFSYKKSLFGSGVFPKLSVDYSISTGDKDSLKNICYNGQSEEPIAVKFSSNGNTISGCLRVEVAISWSNSLNCTPVINGQPTDACYVEFDESVWERKGNYYYLINPLEKDSEVVFFSAIKFCDGLTDNYRGETVNIHLLPSIYQTTNLPENW